MTTFSIIIPTFNRAATLERCLNSVIHQTYNPNLYEIIVIDDGSTDHTQQVLDSLEIRLGLEITVHKFPTNQGRLAARNKGMQLAKNEWFCWLDSDDEYASTYLETIANAIKQNPEIKVFNFGAIVYDEQAFYSWHRDAFMPALREDGRGHVVFKSGGIGTGSFVFAKELARSVGLLPEARTPYGDDESLPAMATRNWPELYELYGKTESGQWLPFGNPWGDDWLYFYLLTRNHISKPLNIHLYIQHLRH